MMLEDKSQHAAQFLSTLIRMHASMKDKNVRIVQLCEIILNMNVLHIGSR